MTAWTEIVPRLWIGGVRHERPPVGRCALYVAVSDTATRLPVDAADRIDWPITDGPVLPDPARLRQLARRIADEAGTVLVGCTGGLNRSALLAARALMYRGATPDDAIAAVRTANPDALNNRRFADWLRHEVPNPYHVSPIQPNPDLCPLCRATPITRRYHECSICWLADCASCKVPMVVWRRHDTRVPADELDHMLEQLRKVAPDGHVDLRRRSVPHHWHAHSRHEPAPTGPPTGAAPTPMRAWRIDRTTGGALTTPYEGAVLTDRTIAATCPQHDPPGDGCGCGVYGCADAESLIYEFRPLYWGDGPFAASVPPRPRRTLAWAPSRPGWALTQVELLPPLVEYVERQHMFDPRRHTAWRARAARIEHIYVIDPATIPDLEDRYGVPVEYVGRRLTRQLVRSLVAHGRPACRTCGGVWRHNDGCPYNAEAPCPTCRRVWLCADDCTDDRGGTRPTPRRTTMTKKTAKKTAKKTTKKTTARKLADYSKGDPEPFQLELPDGDVIEIHAPTTKQAMDAQEEWQEAHPEDQLRMIFGAGAYDKLWPHLAEAPASVLNSLVLDVMDHFGFDLDGSQPLQLPR